MIYLSKFVKYYRTFKYGGLRLANNNLELLNKLTDDEKNMVRRILVDVSSDGRSDDLTSLYYRDYDEIPVDLNTFLSSDVYLGAYTNHGKDIYETWKHELEYIHNPINAVNQWAITGCLDGSVRISMLDGTRPTIEELYIKYKDNPKNNGKDTIDYLYSFDLEEQKYKVGELTRVFFTGYKKCYKITLDNDREIICSAEHPFLLRSKHWRTLNSGLQVGDSLMSFRKEYDPYEKLIVPEKDGTYSKQYTHKMVMEYKNGKLSKNTRFIGHHKDENKQNNHPSNLVLCSVNNHHRYHSSKRWQDDEHRENMRKKHSEYMQTKVASNNTVAQSMSKARWDKYQSKEARRKHLIDIGCSQFAEDYNKFHHPNLIKVAPDEFIEYMEQCYYKKQVYSHFNISRGGFDSYCKRYNINPEAHLKKINNAGRIDANKLELINKLNTIYSKYGKLNMKIIRAEKCFNSGKLHTIEKYLANPNFIETVKNFNHKITKIEYVGIRPTYDLTVRNYHNFALDAGVISKNSIGTGKSQPLSVGIFTPNGYIRMGDVKIGTEVIDGNGNITSVKGIFPQGRRDTYKIIFNDKSYTYCSDEHLWEVFSNPTCTEDRSITSTIDLKRELDKSGLLFDKYIKMSEIKAWEELDAYKSMPISPDIIGYIYGNYSYNNSICSSNPNVAKFKRKLKGVCKKLDLKFNNKRYINLKRIFNFKHIPKQILFSPITIRKKFLKGFLSGNLIDKNSDGGVIVYIPTKSLSDDIAQLIRSLGIFDYISELPGSGFYHTINTSADVGRYIVDIEYVGKKKCQCILVDSPEHTYLTDDLIVTHNTQVVVYSLCYDLYKLMCLKNPSRFYGLGEDTIYLFFFNLTLKLSERTAYARFQRAIQSSPWFMSRGSVSGKKYLEYVPDKNIRFDKGSNLEHALGSACMYVIMDEMSFGKNDDANYQLSKMMEIYNQLHVRLGSRFNMNGIIQGRMYLVSSAKSTNAVLESFIRDNENEPGTHVSRYKQWEVLPKHKWSGKWFKLAVGNEILQSYILGENSTPLDVENAERHGYTVIDVPLELKHDFETDLNRALIDYAGIALQSAYKYIQYGILAQNFSDTNINPFKKEILEIGMYDLLQIKDFFVPEIVPEILYSKSVYVHVDLSKNGDRTGISAVAVLGYKNQNRFNTEGNISNVREMVYKQIFTVGIEAPPNSEIMFQKIRDFIHWLKYDLGWNIVGVSFDGYNSVDMRQQMELDGFKATIISLDKDDKGYSTFRNALAEKRLSMIDCTELTKEITSLERNTTSGKIDHPPQTSKKVDGKTIKSVGKDLADSLCGAVYNASISVDMNALDYMEGITLTDESSILKSSQTTADSYFGLSVDYNGVVSLNNDTQPLTKEEQFNQAIQDGINDTRNILNSIKKANPETKLSDKQLQDLYNNFTNGDFLIM